MDYKCHEMLGEHCLDWIKLNKNDKTGTDQAVKIESYSRSNPHLGIVEPSNAGSGNTRGFYCNSNSGGSEL